MAVLELLHDALCRSQIGSAIRSQSGTAGLAVEQRHTQPLLDFEDMPAKRCLLDIDAARRAAEAASLGGRNQVAKLAQLDHRVNGSSGGAANSVQPPPSAL